MYLQNRIKILKYISTVKNSNDYDVKLHPVSEGNFVSYFNSKIIFAVKD